MGQIRIIGKKGSLAVKGIVEGTGILRYRGNKIGAVDAIINYGIAGDRLTNFFKMYPSARKVPMLNKGVGRAKLSAVQDAGVSGDHILLSGFERGDHWAWPGRRLGEFQIEEVAGSSSRIIIRREWTHAGHLAGGCE